MSDEQEYIRVGLNTQNKEENPFRHQDPFNKSWDDLKDYSGLDQNFRRRTTRNLSKYISLCSFLFKSEKDS